jgi:PhoH-like ATPase
MKYIIDTNVLLKNPEVIKEYDCVIPSDINREIEHLERTRKSDSTLQWNIRNLKRILDENEYEFEDINDYKFEEKDGLDGDYVDNIILNIAIEKGYGMITNDRLLRQKCKQYGVEMAFVENESLYDIYGGYKFVDMDDKEMAEFYSNLNHNKYELLVNQYLIVRNLNKETVDKYRWNGEEHVKLKLPRWDDKSKHINPENDLQECALDLLNNKDIPIKFILGTYGSGKTFLTTKVALHSVLDKGEQSKIMVIRNPIGSGEEIGFLSGDKGEKTNGFFKPIVQHLDGGEQEAFYLEQRGVLDKEIPFYIKGMSFEDTFMFVDEAEDLDIKQIKLVGTRIAKNSVIAFSGDINQSEYKYTKDNGLKHAVESLKGNKNVGIVVLDIDVRSEASRIFGDI